MQNLELKTGKVAKNKLALRSMQSLQQIVMADLGGIKNLDLYETPPTLELCKVLDLPTLNSADLSYLQGQLNYLFPKNDFLTSGTMSNLQASQLFSDLQADGVTAEELRLAVKRYKKTSVGFIFYPNEFLRCIELERFRLYSQLELENLEQKDPIKASQINTRYYPLAADLLIKKPIEMWGISGLCLPRAMSYNTVYKVRRSNDKQYYEVLGIDGLKKYEVCGYSPNYSGTWWRKPRLF